MDDWQTQFTLPGSRMNSIFMYFIAVLQIQSSNASAVSVTGGGRLQFLHFVRAWVELQLKCWKVSLEIHPRKLWTNNNIAPCMDKLHSKISPCTVHLHRHISTASPMTFWMQQWHTKNDTMVSYTFHNNIFSVQRGDLASSVRVMCGVVRLKLNL